jgi:hypothetical protein
LALLLVALTLGLSSAQTLSPNEYDDVVQWVVLHLHNLQVSGPYISPPMIARSLSIHMTCIYDAWATYSPKASSVFNNGLKKRTGSRQDIATSIAVASMRSLEYIFEPRPLIVGNISLAFQKAGFNPQNLAMDPNTPIGVGNIACGTVLSYRKKDGANSEADQFGTLVGGLPFSDYTGYYPVNNPQTTPGITDCSSLRNLNRWQPLLVPQKSGPPVAQKFASPHMAFVEPFAVKPFDFIDQFKGPGILGSNSDAQYRAQVAEVLTYSGQLNDQLKMIAEFWADGPNSTAPPGHWHEIGLETIRNENLSLEKAIKLLFLQANAVFDGGILAWTYKIIWDSARPLAMIQCLYANQTITAWKGPYQGVGTMPGGKWQPYQNVNFITPPFSEYLSGHSTFSAASAGVYRRFFGDDKFRGNSYMVKAGESLFEPKITAGNPGFIAGVTDVPNTGVNSVGYAPATDIQLTWSTWTEAANQAGISRLYGGIHFQSANQDALKLGEMIAEKVWLQANRFFNGRSRRQVGGKGNPALQQ